MKNDDKMMFGICLTGAFSFFLFSQESPDKLSVGGFLLLLVLAAIHQVFLLVRRKPWPERRFGLLCHCMGIFTALLILCMGKLESWNENSAEGCFTVAEGWILFAVILGWCGLCIWLEGGITEKVVLLILLGGFLIRIFYVVLMQSNILQNDLGTFSEGNYGHLGYMHYLYSQGRLPDMNPVGHSQFYHPPLHHIICALLMRLFGMFGYGLEEAQEKLQVLTALYGTLTLFFINKIGVRLRISSFGRGIALAFAAFLPFGIMLGGSLNNDCLVTLLGVMALYFALAWHEDSNYKNIVLMALCIGGAMMAKLSGVLTAPAMAVLMLHKVWKERVRRKEYLKQFLCFGAIAFPLGLWHSVWCFVRFGMPLGYVPRVSEDAAQYIGMYTGWRRFFDFENAFKRLSLSWDNQMLADYNIPVSMVKCAVTGEGYSYWGDPALKGAVTALFWANLILAVLAAGAFFLWLFQKKNTLAEKVFLTAALAVTLGSYVRFCLSFPFVCTMNIRYVMTAAYLALLVFGGVVSGLAEGAGIKGSSWPKAWTVIGGGLCSLYIAGAAVLIFEMNLYI